MEDGNWKACCTYPATDPVEPDDLRFICRTQGVRVEMTRATTPPGAPAIIRMYDVRTEDLASASLITPSWTKGIGRTFGFADMRVHNLVVIPLVNPSTYQRIKDREFVPIRALLRIFGWDPVIDWILNLDKKK